MNFLHSVAVQDQAISADGVFQFDMPVNPLSVILVCLRPLNDTGTLANFNNYLAICQAINRVSVYSKGYSVFQMRGEDAAALNYFRHGILPFQVQHDDTNDERRCVVLPILTGRWPFSTKSCLPSHKRGECVLELDLDIADTGYDGLRISVETIELPDAKPTEWERKVSVNQTWAATGENIIDFSPGKVCRGILLFGTTRFNGAAPAPSWGRLKVLVDNFETGFHSTDIEVASMLTSLWGRQPPSADAHKHRVTTDGNAQTELSTLAGPFEQGNGWGQWAFLDYDPTGDDQFALDTTKSSRFAIQATAESADAVRAIPVEILK